MEPWFNELWFGVLYGAIGGGVGGSLFGILGGIGGTLAARGKGRAWVLPVYVVFFLIGVASLVFGLTAVVCRQPYGIWYPPLLVGVLFSVLAGGGYFVVLARYRQAEQRHMEAQDLRQG